MYIVLLASIYSSRIFFSPQFMALLPYYPQFLPFSFFFPSIATNRSTWKNSCTECTSLPKNRLLKYAFFVVLGHSFSSFEVYMHKMNLFLVSFFVLDRKNTDSTFSCTMRIMMVLWIRRSTSDLQWLSICSLESLVWDHLGSMTV